MDSSRWVEDAKQFLLKRKVSVAFLPQFSQHLADFAKQVVGKLMTENATRSKQAHDDAVIIEKLQKKIAKSEPILAHYARPENWRHWRFKDSTLTYAVRYAPSDGMVPDTGKVHAFTLAQKYFEDTMPKTPDNCGICGRSMVSDDPLVNAYFALTGCHEVCVEEKEAEEKRIEYLRR